MSRPRLVMLVSAAATMLVAAPAGADVTVDFETPALDQCVTVGTQYTGLEFVTGPAAAGYPASLPYVRNTGAARSGTHSLQAGVGCSEEPGSAPRIAFRVSQTRASVTVYVRQEDGVAAAGYQLRALDAGGTRVDGNGDAYTSLPPGAGTYTALSAGTVDNTNRIATLQIVPESAIANVVLRLDDVTLVDGVGGTPPDFSIGPSPVLVIPQGGRGSVRIPVTRYNGASGYPTDTLSEIPSGVSAYAIPNYSNDAAFIEANASLSAATGSRPPLTITRSGPETLGPGPRSTQVPVTITPTLPSVAITEPAEGTQLDRRPYDLTVRGTFSSPRRDPSLCAVVSGSPATPAAPATCADATGAGTDASYRLTVTDGFVPGDNYVTVFLRDSGGYEASATRRFRIADETSGIDLRISGVEVTQGTQKYSLAGGLAIPRLPGTNTVEYGGVQLVADRHTYVRVYANTNRPARSDGRTPAVTARLRVTRNGVEVPGSPFLPQNGPQDLATGGLYASNAERSDLTKGYLFALPPDVARGPLALDARINEGDRPIAECPGCTPNNEMRVTNLRFRPMRILHIYPLRMTDNFMTTCPDGTPPGQSCPRRPIGDVLAVFARARQVFPFRIALHSWVGDVDITEDQRTAAREIARWNTENPMPGPDTRRPRNEDWIIHWAGDWERDHSTPGGEVLGVGRGSFAGMKTSALFCCQPLRIEGFAIVEEQRDLTSVAHEYGHIRGLAHADRGPNPPAGAPDPAANAFGCGGGAAGETSDPDWPDTRGTVVGFAFDTLRRLALPAFDAAGRAANYDFMSYCAGEGNSWVSTRNWDILADGNNAGAAVRATRAGPPAGPGLAVSMRADLNGANGSVTHVQPVSSGAQGDDPAGGHEVVVTGAGGEVISTTRVAPTVVHGHEPGGGGVSLQLHATVPSAPGAEAVALHKDGLVLARRTASPNPPRVRLLAPGPGTRVGRRGTLHVRWRASDADDDRLTVSIDQATTPGGPFRLVGGGYTGSSARIPVSLLRPAPNARLRIRVSDGFREASATSGRLRIATRPPEAAILSPGRGAQVRADAVLALEGQGLDANNSLLGAKRLTWRSGGRLLGKGPLASVTGLAPGRRTITLTAVDAAGSRGTARVRVRVTPVTPRLLTLRAPAAVGRTARFLRLTLAASVPSRVRVTGDGASGRAALGRSSRRVLVRFKPGTAPLALKLRLRGGGGTAEIAVTVPRR